MNGPCLCSDPECRSCCGSYQGMLPPEPAYIRRTVAIGRDSRNHRIEIEIRLETVGSKQSERLDTDLGLVRGPYLQLAMVGGAFNGSRLMYSGQLLRIIRQGLGRYKRLFASREAIEDLLSIWESWHTNDEHLGTEAQIAFVQELDRRWPNASYGFHCHMLRRHFLYCDRGHNYGKGPYLLRVIPETVFDRLIEILEELD